MKRRIHKRDVDECSDKIKQLLKEYNTKLEYDFELGKVILVNNDTSDFNDFDWIYEV